MATDPCTEIITNTTSCNDGSWTECDNLCFTIAATGETIYDPVLLVSSIPSPDSEAITVTNTSGDTIGNVGVWIIPADCVGDVDHPGDNTPAVDYQDLLTWGTKTQLQGWSGPDQYGGLKITGPDGTVTYVTRGAGSKYSNRIVLGDIPDSDHLDFTVELEVPVGMDARRLFISLAVE